MRLVSHHDLILPLGLVLAAAAGACNPELVPLPDAGDEYAPPYDAFNFALADVPDGGLPPARPPAPAPPTATCRDPGEADAKLDLVDDLEDGDVYLPLPQLGGRSGRWTASNDGTAGGQHAPNPFVPTEMKDCARARLYAHIRGSGFTRWGAQITLQFRPAYDVATSHAGLTFWARIGGGGANLRITIPNKDTDDAGGICDKVAGTGGSIGCGNHFGKELVLTAGWTRHTVLWSELRQLSTSGRRVPTFDGTTVYAVNFRVPARAIYDIWIDDVGLIKK